MLHRFTIFFVLLVSNLNLHSWGRTGHLAVGEVASIYLTDKTRVVVNDILKGGGYTFREIGPVADTKRGSKEVFPWVNCDVNMQNCKDISIAWNKASQFHYINVGDILWDGRKWSELKTEKQILDYIAERRKTNEYHNDAYSNARHAINILSDSKKSDADKRVALLWLNHLIGDLAQPFHVGRSKDRGGNTTKINYHGKSEKLHYLWDTGVIRKNQLSVDALANDVYEDYHKDDCDDECDADHMDLDDKIVKMMKNWTLFDFVKDSTSLLEFAYDTSTDSRNINNYDKNVLPKIEEQIYKGGVMLAKILNDIFDSEFVASEQENNITDDKKVAECDFESLDHETVKLFQEMMPLIRKLKPMIQKFIALI